MSEQYCTIIFDLKAMIKSSHLKNNTVRAHLIFSKLLNYLSLDTKKLIQNILVL